MNYELKITGKVQGVGFRYFAQQKANEIGITGWVKNSRDGSVLVVAQGDETDLNTFIDYLQIGPTRARVEGIFKCKMQIQNQFKIFEIQN